MAKGFPPLISTPPAAPLGAHLIVDRKVLLEAMTCRICGCTEYTPCEGGCWWVEPDLCSSCAPDAKDAAAFLDQLRKDCDCGH